MKLKGQLITQAWEICLYPTVGKKYNCMTHEMSKCKIFCVWPTTPFKIKDGEQAVQKAFTGPG